MNPVIFSLYGSCAIRWYGVMVALGVWVYFMLFKTNETVRRYLSSDQVYTLFSGAIIAGVVGGRLLHVVSHPAVYGHLEDVFLLWEGGFSILGTVAAAAGIVIWHFYQWRVSAWPLLDIAALYAPVAQILGRIGCFLAGCCYGVPTATSWAVTYYHPDSLAPLQVALYPAQLYSAFMLLLIFILLRLSASYLKKIPGSIFMLYLFCAGCERFLIDFVRADRVFFSSITGISWYQALALGVMLVGLLGGLSRYYFCKR